MTPEQKRMWEIVARMQEYWNTYDTQKGYTDYLDKTFIEDALYAIGIAMEPERYKYANGFDRFKEFLRGYLAPRRIPPEIPSRPLPVWTSDKLPGK